MKASKPKNSIHKGGLAFGLVFGLGVGVLMTLGLETIGVLVLRVSFEKVLTFFTALTAVGSLMVACLALNEQNKMRQAGTDPVLIVHLGQREDAKELIMIEVTNVGAGAALDVSLRIEAIMSEMDTRIFSEDLLGEYPFPSIPQGQSRSIRLGRGFVILTEPPYPSINTQVSYRNIEGARRAYQFTLDTTQMARLGAEQSMERRRTGALEEISKSLASAKEQQDALSAEVTSISEAFRRISKLK